MEAGACEALAPVSIDNEVDPKVWSPISICRSPRKDYCQPQMVRRSKFLSRGGSVAFLREVRLGVIKSNMDALILLISVSQSNSILRAEISIPPLHM